jgi:ABC-type multidrug transport system ATPase subunit
MNFSAGSRRNMSKFKRDIAATDKYDFVRVRAENLKKVYDNDFTAVKHLDLQVNKGDIYGFLGPNGAGKTTTIRMLTGLLEPTEGQIVLNGLNVRETPQQVKKHIGVLPESHGYYEWMTGREYLLFFASLFGLNKPENGQRTDELLAMVDLTEKAGVRIHQYSRGMRQRLGIARTLLHRPKIIFLDDRLWAWIPKGRKTLSVFCCN